MKRDMAILWYILFWWFANIRNICFYLFKLVIYCCIFTWFIIFFKLSYSNISIERKVAKIILNESKFRKQFQRILTRPILFPNTFDAISQTYIVTMISFCFSFCFLFHLWQKLSTSWWKICSTDLETFLTTLVIKTTQKYVLTPRIKTDLNSKSLIAFWWRK